MRTRIKMCGMTRIEDIQCAASLGVDAIGLVFYPPSPRAVSLEQASTLAKACPVLVDKVALFVNPEKSLVKEVIDATGATLLQFHGDETPEFCQQFGMPYLKALRVSDKHRLTTALKEHHEAPAILLDAYVAGTPGGTGQQFDWSLIPKGLMQRLFLAGGINATNVADAISSANPYAVDVSGGIESAKGIKSAQKMTDFVAAVREISS
ncbi:phosphoribosylanthranilate isomerase [Reinekea marina]|uniref:N-(5'-phosphoribosyl)anthranilate isomerase n=1 Tax=Reinekea marina TaxID=1310421 RepID=A0ABV7WT12_9GAMM|nr:phosphoribosylanthranilate isomerase [Reinekea marina]MDN3648925.1 phosphoribosylanthranilate isomerase [Reinekea marina]